MFLSQRRRYSSWLLFSLYKDSKWHETLATLKSTNISAFLFSVWNFPLVFDELQNYPHASSTPKHHVLVILYQVALLSFWESCSTHNPTLSSTGHLVPWYTQICPCLQHTRIHLFLCLCLSDGFYSRIGTNRMFYSGWARTQDDPAEQFCVARLVPQMNNPAGN